MRATDDLRTFERMTRFRHFSATTTARRGPVALLAISGLALTPARAVQTTAPPPEPAASPDVATVATFGSGLGSGSAIGPDGAIYVTDGNAGTVERIDPATGTVTRVGSGLPPQVLGIGGAMDVAFIDDTAYVLVTMVGGDIVDGDPIGDDVVGIYRLDDDGTFSVVADIGAWSVEHPPTTDFFITTGVQYALQPTPDGFLVTDGHHNRVLRVGLDGAVDEIATFGNVVPTGLASAHDTVFVGLAGPLPHLPEDGQVLELPADSAAEPSTVASGASMIVDVEADGEQLYALSQGAWDDVQEGSPAEPDTGRLVIVGSDGTMTPVSDSAGAEIVLDRPTSLELVDGTAYVVTLAGELLSIQIRG